MNHSIAKLLIPVCCLAAAAFSQEPFQNNQELFDDFMYRQGSKYRSASGMPGPEYWQNGADYTINVELDPHNRRLFGNIEITYYNNSPEALDYIWLHLEQNRFTEDARGQLATPVTESRFLGDNNGGFEIYNVRTKVGKRNVSSRYLITDTRMQVILDSPVEAGDGETTITMDFSFRIPETGVDRTGILKTEKGEIFSMAQWYPRVAVFDDIKGWNTEPYLGAGEFYLGYGDIEYNITVPYDHIVVGSGELQNPKDVLTPEQQNRLRIASNSDESIYIIASYEAGNTFVTRPQQGGKLTWRFKMENTRDVAFAVSKAFIWDAARINLPGGKQAMAMSVYPDESNGNNGWERSTEYTKAAIEHYSEKWYPYPWPVAVNVASNVRGMEYPGLSFCSYQARGQSLWGVTDHEFGHMWFPMIVGSNEKRHVWMDEGFNTFINHYSTEAFNDGEYNPRMAQQKQFVLQWLKSPSREPISTYPDMAQGSNLGMTAYYKPAYGLYMLREYILEPQRFDLAFEKYIDAWAYKHPGPADFFNLMENVTGEDLNWFWKGWFYSNDNIDLAVDDVRAEDGYYLVTFVNKGIPMPVEYEVTYADGTKERRRLPVEIWQRGNRWIFPLETNKRIAGIEIDPDKILADIDENNNVWKN